MNRRTIAAALTGLVLGAGGTAALPQDTRTPIEATQQLEEAYFAKTGKYLQVLPNNKLPHYESGKTKDKLGKDLPANAIVNVYDGPGGKGYQVVYEDADAIYRVGYGPQAEEMTSIERKNVYVNSTSTPQ